MKIALPLNSSTGYASVNVLNMLWFTFDNCEVLHVCTSKVDDVNLRYVDFD